MYILKPKETNNNLKYIYHYLKFSKNKIMDLATYTTGLGNIKQESLKSFQIPIPSLSLQQQIVEALDSIYDTIEGNNKLINNYEKIKKGIIWSNTLNMEKKKLGDVVENIKSGRPIKKEERNGNKYPYYAANGIDGYVDEFIFNGEYIICAQDGSIGATHYVNQKFYASNHIWALSSNKINNKYIYLYLKDMIDYKSLIKGSVIPKLTKEDLITINIPIPSKKIQEHIVKECEYYDNLIETLKKENERLQNNKIIDMVLKSVSNEIDDQQDEISEDESEEEKPQPKKTTKETNKVKEILKQVIEKEELDEHHLKKSKESPKKNKSKSEKMTDI